MNEAATANTGFAPLTWPKAVGIGLAGTACFHAVYTPAESDVLAVLILGCFVALAHLARLRTKRQCFYSGLGMGFLCYAPQLECFWRIFGPGAVALWLILAFWIGLFVLLLHLALVRLGTARAAVLLPFLWTGLEYFRSELYYLRFSWLNGGMAFAGWPMVPFSVLGNYGVSFVLAGVAAISLVMRRNHLAKLRLIHVVLFVVIVAMLAPAGINRKSPKPSLVIAGVQLEFPDEKEILEALDKIIAMQPNLPIPGPHTITNVDLIVLSEYTLDGPPPESLHEWCRINQKHLIVGGKDPLPDGDFYNTAFVINPEGGIIFKQVKAVPIQFFRDGAPAPEQRPWDSPWGRIGILICYDLSYARVTDTLIRQGAQMLIVPTMDVVDWGRHQHVLHARVTLVRAAEYGIPIFRVASSGISQAVGRSGQSYATASFPGQGGMLFFAPALNRPGSVPLDRWLAPLCVLVTGLFVAWLAATAFRRARARQLKLD